MYVSFYTLHNYCKLTTFIITVSALNLTGIALSSTSIYLHWVTPIHTAQYYLVNVDELQTNRIWTFHAVDSHVNIISLHPYYTYRCSVAIFANITHPYSNPIFVTTHQSGTEHQF